MNIDKKWMAIAIEQAIEAEGNGEVPVGAVLVHDNKLIAKSYNQSISNNSKKEYLTQKYIPRA